MGVDFLLGITLGFVISAMTLWFLEDDGEEK